MCPMGTKYTTHHEWFLIELFAGTGGEETRLYHLNSQTSGSSESTVNLPPVY